jgi:hypothetical protein
LTGVAVDRPAVTVPDDAPSPASDLVTAVEWGPERRIAGSHGDN